MALNHVCFFIGLDKERLMSLMSVRKLFTYCQADTHMTNTTLPNCVHKLDFLPMAIVSFNYIKRNLVGTNIILINLNVIAPRT